MEERNLISQEDQETIDKRSMKLALVEAGLSLFEDCVLPVACVITQGQECLTTARMRAVDDPRLHHPVMKALSEARTVEHLKGATIYTTLEPCVMCFGASSNCGIARIVFALENPFWENVTIHDPSGIHLFPQIQEEPVCREEAFNLFRTFYMPRMGGPNVRSHRDNVENPLRNLVLAQAA